MKLYQSVGPNPRVALMFVAEKGVTIERAFVDIMAGENRQPEYLSKNRYAGTPLLETDEGNYIAESIAICEYIEELHPSPTLIGSTPAERAETRMWMRQIDIGIIIPMTTAFRGAEGLPMFKDRMRCLPEAADGLKAFARDGLEKLDGELAGKAWIAGDRFTLADILLYCFVEFGAQVGQPVTDTLTNIKAWQARVAARPSAAASANPKQGI